MPSLLIETATERGIITILEGNQLLFHRDLPLGINNSKWIFPTIQEGLTLLGLRAKDLSSIAVGIGPGSFTGIRVAAATAQSMAYALKIPLIGIPSLTCFAPSTEGYFTVLIDAKIGGVYLLNGLKQAGAIIAESDSQVISWDNFRHHVGKGRLIITPNATALKAKVEALYSDLKLEWMETSPNPYLMGKIANAKLLEGEISENGTLELLYLRKSQAERKML